MTLIDPKISKIPRWIITEAGQWAYLTDGEWRRTADRTFGVSERRALMEQAERLRAEAVAA